MRKTVKFLALLMVLAMAITCFVACDNKDEKDNKEKTEATDKEAKETSTADDEKAVEAVVEGFYDTFFKEVDKFDELKSNCEEFLDPDGDVYKKIEEVPEELEELGEMGVYIYNSIYTSSEYEIKEVEIDGDEATVDVETTIVDNVEVMRLFYEKCGELGIWEADEIEPYWNEFKEAIDYAAEEADTVTNNKKVILKKIDGEWLITKIK